MNWHPVHENVWNDSADSSVHPFLSCSVLYCDPKCSLHVCMRAIILIINPDDKSWWVKSLNFEVKSSATFFFFWLTLCFASSMSSAEISCNGAVVQFFLQVETSITSSYMESSWGLKISFSLHSAWSWLEGVRLAWFEWVFTWWRAQDLFSLSWCEQNFVFSLRNGPFADFLWRCGPAVLEIFPHVSLSLSLFSVLKQNEMWETLNALRETQPVILG